MTGYDPFSYGQIKLGEEKRGDAAPSPEDVLFEDAGPSPEAVFGDDDSVSGSDWEMPEQSLDALLEQNASAADAGLAGAGPGASTPAKEFAPPPAEPASLAERAPVVDRVQGGGRPPRRSRSKRARTRTRPLARRPGRRRLRFLGAVVPPLFFSAGGGAAAWFHLVEQSVVMAGIAAATGLVGAVFTRLLFR